jgi:ABC-type transport system involved in cytochrome c biogenesis permease subunit
MKRWFPLALTLVLALWIAGSVRVPSDKPGTFAANEFGQLPIVANGRVQPLDTFARNSLLQLREKQKANLEPWKEWYQGPKMLTASQWLMDMTLNPAVADTHPVFRIDNPELKGLLALPMVADTATRTDGKHFSWLQIQPKLRELQEQAKRAGTKNDKERNSYENATLHLMNGVALYMKLQNTLQPQNSQNSQQELAEYMDTIGPGVAAARAQQAGKADYDKAALDRLMHDLQRFDAMTQVEPPLVVPSLAADAKGNGWQRMGEALMDLARGAQPHFAIASYARIADAYRANDPAAFNTAVAEYRGRLAADYSKQLAKGSGEQRFNFFEPFYRGMIVFVLAALLAVAFWIRPVQWEFLRRTSVWLCLLGMLVLSAGIAWRVLIGGYAPVTNLYSSAVFIGWGAAILGLILEAFWKNGIGAVISSVCAFTALEIAHHLSLNGDTIEMMRAVLDSNFWLTTHVLTVTSGYTATFVAGFLAIIFVVLGMFTSMLQRDMAKSLVTMVYGILCFATLLSFVGTVTGGIWADQSWGRFWGWDVKENGALMIVIWNAVILHARWGAIVRERGLMALAIFGNIVTAWSWFGVNMLGIGLHSYGFMDAAFRWLLLADGLCLLLITICTFPTSIWKSFAKSDANKGIRQAVGITALAFAAMHVIRVTVFQGSGEYFFYVEIALWALVSGVTLIRWIVSRSDVRSEIREKSEQTA